MAHSQDPAAVQAAIDRAIEVLRRQEGQSHSFQDAPPGEGCRLANGRACTVQAASRMQHANATPTDYSQMDTEWLATQFSRIGFEGIRSMPNALHPNFRMHLHGALVILGQARRAALRRKAADVRASFLAKNSPRIAEAMAPTLAHSTKGNPLHAEVAKGQTAPGLYSAMRHIFSVYDHGHSDLDAYARAVLQHRHEVKAGRLYGDILVTAVPRPPKGATLFEEFKYMSDPYEGSASRCKQHKCMTSAAVQNPERRQPRHHPDACAPGINTRRYVPFGKPKPETLAKSALGDCLVQLHAGLAADWPLSFVQVFVDTPGSIVIAFHRHLAEKEGDITAYMNQHHRLDLTVQTFKLAKDTTYWGIVAENNAQLSWGVFYLYWPPWAVRRRVIPPHLAGSRPKHDSGRVWHAGNAKRDPFGKRTSAGLLTNFNTRVAERTMGFKGASLL